METRNVKPRYSGEFRIVSLRLSGRYAYHRISRKKPAFAEAVDSS
jgi:hypothetical protein